MKKIRFYNTLSKRVEEFEPLEDNKVKYYTCGPTVYDYAHIGNFATFVRQDLLKRLLEYLGYEVIHVMNITDIDDKTIKRSGEKGITLKELTEFYLKEFLKDMESLNIKKPTKLVNATDEIDAMIEVISGLIEKGYAYERDGSVYFSVKKFKDYGKLSGIKVDELKAGARIDVDEYDKDNPADFALWKKSTEEEIKRGIYWESPWGKGRPGWHIECSVINLRHLGETIDIHSGGIDLVFPHHENEIAQSEAYTGKEFSRYWFHCDHILVDGKKMSKSLGNFYTVRDILNMGYNPMALRLLILSGHYRKQLNFTFENLKQAEKNLESIVHMLQELKEIEEGGYDEEIGNKTKEFKERFVEKLTDDLNTPEAFAEMFEFIHFVNNKIKEGRVKKKNAEEIIEVFYDLDRILGLKLKEFVEKEVPEEIRKMLEEREKLRKEKRFEEADKIREEIKKLGFYVEDTPEGPKLRTKISKD